MPRVAKVTITIFTTLLIASAVAALALLCMHQMAPETGAVAIHLDGRIVQPGQWTGSWTLDVMALWATLTLALLLAGVALLGALLLTWFAVGLVALMAGLPLLLWAAMVWLVMRASRSPSPIARA